MSLKIWLPLNGTLENKGVSDATITNNGATVNTNGKIGSCYSFNGTNNYLSISNFNPNAWSEISISFWYKATTDMSGFFCIRGTSNNAGTISIVINANGFSFRDTVTTGTMKTFAFPNGFPLDTWTHVVCIYKMGEVFMYLNGEEQVHDTSLINSNRKLDVRTSGATVRIGRQQTTSANYYYNGLLNDFRIYDHALSAMEVKEIAQGLILHYKLNQSNPNLIPFNIYQSTLWTGTIAAHEEYQGRLAYRIKCSYLYNNTNRGTDDIFLGNITYQENIQYTLSVTWRDDYRTDNKSSSMRLKIVHSDGTTITMISPANTLHEWKHQSITSTAGKTISKITSSYGNGGQLYITDLKLEIGTLDTGMDFKDIIEDSSGYNHNGIITGILISKQDTARYSKSLYSANGSSNYITTPTLTMPINAVTFNIWFKSSNTTPTSDYHMLVDSVGNATGRQHYEFAVHKTGYFRSGVFVNGIRYAGNSTSTTGCDGNWHMFTLTYNGSKVSRYYDGVLESSSNVTISTGLQPTATLRLFKDGYSTYACVEASLSDFRIYCTALSATDIQSLYKTSMKIDNKNNVHIFELNETKTNNKLLKTGVLQDCIVEPYLQLEDGSKWKLMLYHQVDKGTHLFTQSNATYCNDFGLYSRLNEINNYSYDNKYEYYVIQDGKKFRWTQTSSPTATSITGLTTVSGYTNSVNGLAKPTSLTQTYIGYNTWWGACGCWTSYSTGGKTGIPGFGTHNATGICENYLILYTRISETDFKLKNNYAEAINYIER